MGATARNVDFTNVKDGGAFNRNRIPAGDYLATVTKVDDAPAKDETPMYVFSIKINKRPSSVFPYFCKLQENQLWKLRNIAIAAGKAVPKKRMKFDPNGLVGKVIGVTIEDAEDYKDREQSEIAGLFPAAELIEDAPNASTDDDGDDEGLEDDADLGDDDAIEDEPAVEEEPEDEAVEEDEEAAEEPANPYADLDRTALKAQLKKLDPAFVAKKSQTDDDLRALLTEKTAAGEVSDDDLEELDIDNI